MLFLEKKIKEITLLRTLPLTGTRGWEQGSIWGFQLLQFPSAKPHPFYLSSGSVFVKQFRILNWSLFAAFEVQGSVATGPLLHFQLSPDWKCRSQYCPLERGVLWSFPGNTSLLGSAPVFLIWFPEVFIVCIFKYPETFWSQIFLTVL